jgi:hypothetical protein
VTDAIETIVNTSPHVITIISVERGKTATSLHVTASYRQAGRGEPVICQRHYADGHMDLSDPQVWLGIMAELQQLGEKGRIDIEADRAKMRVIRAGNPT